MAVPGRDNGLRAQEYAPLARLDPRIADAMLEMLRRSGVAAYSVPVGNEINGHFGTHLPDRPTDRLYVDAEATEPAWRVLCTCLPSMDVEREGTGADPELPPDLASEESEADEGRTRDDRDDRRDEEAIWERLVAAYHSEPPDPVPPWPASEDLDADEKADGKPDSQTGQTGQTGPGEEAEEGHFVPPAPPPLPRPDPVNGISWLGLFGGPTYLLVPTMVGWAIPGWTAFIAVAAFIGGFVTLVVRMGDEPPQDFGSDDGAVV